MKILYTIIFVLLIFSLSGQENLVPNPGFEKYLNLPVGNMGGQLDHCLDDWENPNMNLSDYFHKNSLYTSVRTPKNDMGYQIPHSGNAYAGICLQNEEYLHVKLLSVPEKGKKYCVKLYISCADNSESYVNEFMMYFSRNRIMKDEPFKLDYCTHLIFNNDTGFKDTVNWICLADTFTATGNEGYLTFGYFNKNIHYHCHYYVDDVFVKLIGSNEECSCRRYIYSKSPSKPLILHNIFFEFDRSELLPASYKELDKLCQFLINNPGLHIEIRGHTDSVGSGTHNKILSENRAKAVVSHLIKKGIEKSRLSYTGYGSTKPIADNKTEKGREQNRRVELKIKTPGSKPQIPD